MENEAVERVAYACAARFGVQYDGGSLFQVSVAVEIGVANARSRFDDRDVRVLPDEVDQPFAAARNDQVDVTHGV